MPGLVDAHVHLNEPGRTEWEGFETGTKAAASGGVTTVVDMPLNAIPPTTTVENFKVKVAAAQGKCWVDVGLYGGVIPGNEAELKGLVEAGVRGFKGFLIESGVSQLLPMKPEISEANQSSQVDEFPAISATDIRKAMHELKDQPTTLMFHAEMIPPIADSVGDAVQSSDPPLAPHGDLTAYHTFLHSRPPSFETYAISEILSMAPLAPDLHLHIVHLSATECIPLLREARASGINITAETCFHYLGLKAEDIEDGDTRHKCCPPIRGSRNQDGLWSELAGSKTAEGCIRTVVSDHSPCTPELKILPEHIGRPTFPHSDSGIDMTQALGEEVEEEIMDVMGHRGKKGNFFAAWGGISSVGLGLPILHTTAIERGGARGSLLELTDIVRLCSQETAKQVGLAHRKGGLKVGMDADICVFDDGEEWIFGKGEMRWKNKCSPWEGKRFIGKVKETWVRARQVWDGRHVVGQPSGELLLEKRTA